MKFTETINKLNDYMVTFEKQLRLVAINGKPLLFAVIKLVSNQKTVFHCCHPRKLAVKLAINKYSSIVSLNSALNTAVGRVHIVENKRYCGRCNLQIPDDTSKKLAIIEAADKLTLR